MALSVLAYNLTRVMNIVGIKPLIAAIGAWDALPLAFASLQGRSGWPHVAPALPPGPNRKNMLETVASQRTGGSRPPRHPLQRVITRPSWLR